MKTQLLFRTLLAIVFACFSFQYSFSQTSELEKELEKDIALMNQECPFIIDEQFNMCALQISLIPRGICFDVAFDNYSSAPYKFSYYQLKEAKEEFKKYYIEGISVNPAVRKYLTENNAKYILRFHNYDVTSISSFDKNKFKSDNHDYFDIVITKKDLKKRD